MQKDSVQQRYLSVSAAAIYLGMSQSALRYKLALRRLAYCKVGKTVRIDRLELDRFLSENTIPPVGYKGRR